MTEEKKANNGDLIDNGAIQPVETPGTEQTDIVEMMADEDFVGKLEMAAKNAPRLRAAMKTMLVSISEVGDWTDFEGTACLSSAGAERYLKAFPFQLSNWQSKKEEFTDKNGKAYKWEYTCTANLWNRVILARGEFSTRNKFKGYTSQDGWKDISEILEGDIKAAAYHICMGNAVKALLGLRGLRTEELLRIVKEQGGDVNIITKVEFSKGSGGGAKEASAEDNHIQAELGKMMEEMTGGDVDAMKQILIDCTKFKGKDDKEVSCNSLKRLTGKWLEKTAPKIKKRYEDWKKMTDAPDNNPEKVPTEGTDDIPF